MRLSHGGKGGVPETGPVAKCQTLAEGTSLRTGHKMALRACLSN